MPDARLVQAISEVFGMPPAQVTADSDRDSISDWDSVGHLRLILLVEEFFELRFPTADIPTLTSAARIQEALDRAQKG